MAARSGPTRRWLATSAVALMLVAAACGSDSDTDSEAALDDPSSVSEPANAPEAVPEDDEVDDTGSPTTDAPDPDDSDTDASTEDTVVDDDSMPSGEATGEPFVIGVQNPEGDPNGSFPEASLAIQAAADYINAELGGLGGRPIEIELCKTVISPDDSQRCANELSAAGVDLAVSTINFFGNHFAIFRGSDIPVIVSTPVTIADFTTEGVYSIGSGGGCLGFHTGLVQIATDEIEELEGIEVGRVGVPWADTPPGVVCYNDLEAKPLDVIAGREPGASERAGERPELEYLGVPVAPAAPDLSPQATEVLDFEPDVIIFSGQAADCWNLVDALGRVGWTPEQTPLVLAPSCVDFEALRAAGDLAVGIYLESTPNSVLGPLDAMSGQQLEDATVFQTKASEYGVPDDMLFTGFASGGFSTMMNIWQVANRVEGEVTGQSVADGFAATDGTARTFAGSPLNCSGAPEPYVAVCGASIGLSRWDGEQLVTVIDELNAIDLVAGTELRPGG